MIFVYILENGNNGQRMIGETNDILSVASKLKSMVSMLSEPYSIVYQHEFADPCSAAAYKRMLMCLSYEEVSRIIAKSSKQVPGQRTRQYSQFSSFLQ
jgi:hypothetical protein